MGRKPNQLILKHFVRGAKLNDSSNRYEHTCRACNEKFPKGRIESLQTHITKKCTALSVEERRQAIFEISNFNPSDGLDHNGRMHSNGAMSAMPLRAQPWGMTPLETLAEVSRQMDMTEKHDDRPVHDRGIVGGSKPSGEPRIEKLELQEQYTLDNPPLSYEQRGQREKKHVPFIKNNRRESEASLPPANFAPHMSQNRSMSPSLVMAATSMAAAAEARFMVDPQLLGEDTNKEAVQKKSVEHALTEANAPFPSFSENMFNHNMMEQQMAWPTGPDGNHYPDAESVDHPMEDSNMLAETSVPRTLAMNPSMTIEFSTEFGTSEKGNKPKVRGKFTASRRKEVQDVRKMGACMRCRMLKKPCSHESPCVTCRGVESARTWKVPCIRDRLGDKFHMYSAGLHVVLAYHEVTRRKGALLLSDVPRFLEVSHFPETTVYAMFHAREGHSNPAVSNIDPGLEVDFNVSSFKILDNDSDDLPMKLEAYVKRMSNVFFEKEPSKFMRITLTTAQVLAAEKNDDLLSQVLDLWAVVHILVDQLDWFISERVDPDAPAGQGPIIDRHSSNYNLLCLQLNAAAEKKAAAICKKAFSNLEKRLMQRVPNAFETFLVGIILLNCVERSTWLFKSWEQDTFHASWPLDPTAGSFCAQGDQMTDMLDMLLRVRYIPPKTYTRDDGIIATDVNDGQREYFEKLQLNYKDVLNQQISPVFDPAESRCYELRFCSKLILPIAAA